MEIYLNKYTTASLTAIIAILFLVGMVIAQVSDTAPTSATVTVNEFLSVTLTNVPVTFGNMDPGTTANATVDNGFPATATIGSESNVNANVATKANQTDFVSGSNTFAVSNMEWSDAVAGTYADYLITDATVCSDVNPGNACNIYHQLTVPGAQAAGEYQVGIIITATSA